MYLNTLAPALGARHKPKRVGRGIGSGIGKTCTRGHKGQRARTGTSIKANFEGGQMPIYRRLPKRGFRSKVNIHTEELSLSVLESFNEDAVITLQLLKDWDLIKNATRKVRVVFDRDIQPRKISGLYATSGARRFLIEVELQAQTQAQV
jgi:large subunit ribosomal protein L15